MNEVNEFLQLSGIIQNQLYEQNIKSTDTVYQRFTEISQIFQQALASNDEATIRLQYAALQKLQTDLDSTSMFQEIGAAPSKATDPHLKSYHEQALKFGISEDVLNKFEENLSTTPSSFDAYIDALHGNMQTEESRQKKLKDIADMQEASIIQQYGNLDTALRKNILNTYNTSCCAAPDIGEFLHKHSYVPNDQNATLWAINNIKQPAVAEAVDYIKEQWDTNPNIEQFVLDYLYQHGATDETISDTINQYIQYLPTHYKEEDSPDMYLIVLAIEILEGKNVDEDPNEVLSLLSASPQAMAEFAARFENCTEQGVPTKAAETIAGAGVAATLGTLAGKALHMRYGFADSFNKALDAGLGDYADVYHQNREQVQARKAELKQQAYEQQMAAEQQAQTEQQPKVSLQKEQYYQQQQDQYYQQDPRYQQDPYYQQDPRYQQNQYYQQNPCYQQAPPYGRRSRMNVQRQREYNGTSNMFHNRDRHDFSPQVNPTIIIIGIHIIIGLLLALILGTKGWICFGCLSLSAFGWLQARTGFMSTEQSKTTPILFITLGYLVFLLVMIW